MRNISHMDFITAHKTCQNKKTLMIKKFKLVLNSIT